MTAFWTLARGMLRYRLLVVATFAFATLAGLSLVGGLLGAGPVLDTLLGKSQKGLPELATELNASIALKGGIFSSWQIPNSVIAELPQGVDAAMYWIIGTLVVVTAVASFSNFMHSYLSQTVVNRTVTAIRHRVFHSIVRAPLSRVIRGGATDAVSRLINDTNQLTSGFTQLLSRAMIQTVKGIAGLVAALAFDWVVTIVAIFAVAPLVVVIQKLGKKIRRASGAALKSQGEMLGVATQAVQGLKVVKVSTAERLEGGRFHRINKHVLKEQNRVRTAKALAGPLTEMLTLILFCGLILVASKAIAKGHLNQTDFILTLTGLAVAGASFKPLTGIIAEIQASDAAAQRVMEILAEPQEPGHGVKLKRLSRHARNIRLDNVHFTYPGATNPSLNGVSLTIKHGERVAIVGPNGCGKSTLLSMLTRLYDPTSGAVLVDDTDVRSVSVRSLREQIGVVTQETVLFKDSILNNIAYGNDNASRERVIAAAKQARAHEFIERLPQGYDTVVAEQGMSLSGGQRQRISIARAILRNPAILILDEATSMIDAESEHEIAAALTEFMRAESGSGGGGAGGRTCVVVAHRLSTVIDSDRIVVMEKGTILDIGRHEELLQRCGLYQRLVRTQMAEA